MHVAFWWEQRDKRTFGRPRHKWQGNINMDLQEVGWRGMEWMTVPQDRDRFQALVDAAMNLKVL